MTRIISPPANQLDNLRQPLTRGERMVFDFFNHHLPIDWEIYLQPHLNGLCPDIVLLNPNAGIAVFEIKDWDLNAMDYWVQSKKNQPPQLMATRKGEVFSKEKDNPIAKVQQYRDEIYNLYCPRLSDKFGFAAITAGVIFPFANHNEVCRLFAPFIEYYKMDNYPQYNSLSGREVLQQNDLPTILPEALRIHSNLINESLAKDLRNWLIEPDAVATQRQPLEMDKKQLHLATSRTTSGYRRIKGPAGSGKSLVLAARAAQLANEGKKVLVVTYNITLWHYLKDIASRYQNTSKSTKKNITWMNFHYWCKRVCFELGYTEKYKQLWHYNDTNLNRKNILNEILPNLVSTILETNQDYEKYDAILIDEGQDFRLTWWDTLKKACHPEGEMLLVADATQDIYDTAPAWTDEAMKNAGFSGQWVQLEASYRMPQQAMLLARHFAEQYLPQETINLPQSPQGELEFYPCKLKWIHTKSNIARSVCIDEFYKMVIDSDPNHIAMTDIIFLSVNQRFGQKVVEEINNDGIKVNHTFSTSPAESRRKKLGFYMGSTRIKATTLHSFKGWEARALVIYIGEQTDKKSLALIYTGLTRLKRHVEGSQLTVISTANELKNFGKNWQVYKEIY